MRILVVGDTWGAREPLRYILNYEKCDRIIFLGDYVSDLESLSPKVNFPPYVVKGECDSFHTRPFEIITNICGFKFYIVNGFLYKTKNNLASLKEFASERDFDVVLYSCVKKPQAEVFEERTMFLTPGSFGRPALGDKCNYMVLTITPEHFDYEFKEYNLERVYEDHKLEKINMTKRRF